MIYFTTKDEQLNGFITCLLPQRENNLNSLDARVLQPRVSRLSCYCRRWAGPWSIYVMPTLSLSALPGPLSRGGHARRSSYLRSHDKA